MGFPTTSKLFPTSPIPPYFGVEKLKKAKNRDFALSHDKNLLQS